MSRPSFTPSEGGKTRYKRKFDALTEDTSAQRPENEKDAQLRAKPEARGSKRIKLSAVSNRKASTLNSPLKGPSVVARPFGYSVEKTDIDQ